MLSSIDKFFLGIRYYLIRYNPSEFHVTVSPEFWLKLEADPRFKIADSPFYMSGVGYGRHAVIDHKVIPYMSWDESTEGVPISISTKKAANDYDFDEFKIAYNNHKVECVKEDSSFIKIDKDGSKLRFEKENGDVAIYDFKDKSVYVNGRRVKKLDNFLKNHRISNFYSDTFYDFLLILIATENPKYKNIMRFIEQLPDYSLVEERLAYEGLNYKISSKVLHGYGYKPIYSRRLKPLKTYPKSILNFIVKNNIVFDANAESFIQYFKKKNADAIMSVLQKDQRYIDRFWGNSILHDVADWIEEFNLDIESILSYILYLEQFEGIRNYTITREIPDYYRMQKTMGRKFDKYPKMFLSVFNITRKNYDICKSENDNKMFIEAVNTYKDLEFEDKKYKIVTPMDVNDLVSEGEALCHCVGSYVNPIIEKRSKILFVREKDNPNVSLVTIEVNKNREGEERLYQASARYNATPNDEIMEFLQKFADKKLDGRSSLDEK